MVTKDNVLENTKQILNNPEQILNNQNYNPILGESISINLFDGLRILLISLLAGFLIRFICKRYSTTFSSRGLW